MKFPSDLLKPLVVLPIVLGVLAIAGWWAYASERSELATTRETLAATQAEHQQLQTAHDAAAGRGRPDSIDAHRDRGGGG